MTWGIQASWLTRSTGLATGFSTWGVHSKLGAITNRHLITLKICKIKQAAPKPWTS